MSRKFFAVCMAAVLCTAVFAGVSAAGVPSPYKADKLAEASVKSDDQKPPAVVHD